MWPHDARDKYRLTADILLVDLLNARGLHAEGESTARSALRDARRII
jgi:hypothetical protein